MTNTQDDMPDEIWVTPESEHEGSYTAFNRTLHRGCVKYTRSRPEIEGLGEALEKTDWKNKLHDQTTIHDKRPATPDDVYESRIRDAAKAYLELTEGE